MQVGSRFGQMQANKQSGLVCALSSEVTKPMVINVCDQGTLSLRELVISDCTVAVTLITVMTFPPAGRYDATLLAAESTRYSIHHS